MRRNTRGEESQIKGEAATSEVEEEGSKEGTLSSRMKTKIKMQRQNPVRGEPLEEEEPMTIEEEGLAEAEEARSSLADALLVTRQGINPLDVPKKEETVADPEIGESICCKKKRMGKASHPITPQPPGLLTLKLESAS